MAFEPDGGPRMPAGRRATGTRFKGVGGPGNKGTETGGAGGETRGKAIEPWPFHRPARLASASEDGTGKAVGRRHEERSRLPC